MALPDSAWGHDGKTFDGKEMRQLVASLTGGAVGVSGPSTACAVSAQASPNNTVKVAAGGAVLTATGAGLFGSYHFSNDADLTSPTITPTSTNPRIDLVIFRVTTGVPAIEIVQGVAAPSPTEPTITGDNYLLLARLDIPASTTNITNAMITDRRGRLAGGIVVCTSTTRPASPFAGLEIYETDTGLEYSYSGSAWVLMSGVGAWQTPTFLNGWLNYDPPNFEVAKYRLEPGGVVRVRGLIRTGTIATAAFNLPAGFRPPNRLVFATETSSGHGRLDISAAGDVIPTSGGTAYYSINSVFSAL